MKSASDWKDKRESKREKMKGNNVRARAAEVDMDMKMALRRLYAP